MKQVSANFQSVVLLHPSTPGFNWFIASVASLPTVGNVFDGDRVVVVDVEQVEDLLHETFEELRSKEAGKTCFRFVYDAIIVLVKAVEDPSQ